MGWRALIILEARIDEIIDAGDRELSSVLDDLDRHSTTRRPDVNGECSTSPQIDG